MPTSSAHFEVNPTAISRILQSPESRSYRLKQGRLIADAWRANIHRITGATDRSIDVVEEGKAVVVEADSARDSETAWKYLEYGTGSMRARHPGRRAINAVRG